MLLSRMCDDLLFLENYLDIYHLGFFIQILTVNNNKLFPIIFWIFIHLGFFYPNINGE
jgi:hypothetical protein